MTETVVFSRPTGGPEIEWNGAAYVGAWGYYLFGGIPHLSMGEISREGTVIGPLHVADTETSPYPGRVASCAGEAVVAWIEGRNAVGEFVRGTRVVTTVIPYPPAITVARCCRGMIEVCWTNFGTVDEMWIEIVSTVPFQTRVHEDRIEKSCGEYPLRTGDVYVRVRALNPSGGSAASELPIPPARLRAVRR